MLKIIVVHPIRGNTLERNLEKYSFTVGSLHQHSIQLAGHVWKKDNWDTKVIGFLQVPNNSPPTTVVTPSQTTELPSNVKGPSEVDVMRAEVRRYQEEMGSYIRNMETFQALLETILLQNDNLSVLPTSLPFNKKIRE
jgi:hypothetical protein